MKDPRQNRSPRRNDELLRRNRNFRNMLVVIGAVVFALLLLQSFLNSSDAKSEIPYSDFIARVEGGQVKEVTIRGNVAGASHRSSYGDPRYQGSC